MTYLRLGSPIGALVEERVLRAVRYALETQDSRGAWEISPDPRLFDTGLVTYALSGVSLAEARDAVGRARVWLERASPQRHHELARHLEEYPRALVYGSPAPIDLRAPAYHGETFRRKTLLLRALAAHAGAEVLLPPGERDVREQVAHYYENRHRIQLKRWGKTDLLAMHVLLASRFVGREALADAARELARLQSEDGSFCHNPVSTAMAFLALTQAAPESEAWQRCFAHLLASQRPDGTWRFISSDVWDTTLTLRSFRGHPVFREQAMTRAVEYLLRRQNADGGWGFRAGIESDNDTTACALLALQDVPDTTPSVKRALGLLAAQQMEDGLWRTWQSRDDLPIHDCVAHVVAALGAYRALHEIPLASAKAWLVEQHERHGRWSAWYRNMAYETLEVSSGLDARHPVVQRATDELLAAQNPDGGFGAAPGGRSTPSATGLALAALLEQHPPDARVVEAALVFLVETQDPRGTWRGEPELHGPRPLLYHLQTNTHAFASTGLMAAWRVLHA